MNTSLFHLRHDSFGKLTLARLRLRKDLDKIFSPIINKILEFILKLWKK